MKKKSFVIVVVLLLLTISYAVVENDHKVKVADGTLFGTLNHEDYNKLVIFIAGSGPTDRDGNSDILGGRNDSLKELSRQLNKNGISTFRYDKRTSGKSASTFNLEGGLFDDMVDDGQAVLEQMKQLGYDQIYIIGHSQGALIAEIIGSDEQVEGVVSLCGTLRSIDEVLIEQFKQYDSETSAQATEIIEFIKSGKFEFEVPEKLEAFFGESNHFLYSWMVYDPIYYMEPIADKLLLIYGDRDVQVSAEEVDPIGDVYHYEVIKDMNHVLKYVKDDHENTDSYINPIYRVNTELVDIILEFVL